MALMAYRRTTVVLAPEDERALREASRAQGLSQSEVIREGIRLVAGRHRRRRGPALGWLRLSRAELREILAEDVRETDA